MEDNGKKVSGRRAFAGGIIVGSLVASILCGVTLSGLLLTDSMKVNASGVLQNSAQALGIAGSRTGAVNQETQDKIQTLEYLIDRYYIDAENVTAEQKRDGIYKGLIYSLGDIYSEYYTPEEFEELNKDTEGIFYGIGAYMTTDKTTGLALITGTVPDSPAEKAGIRSGDIIVEVDGEDVSSLDLDQVVSIIRGEEGTDVTLTIYREGESDYLDFTMTRTKQNMLTVSGEMLDDNIGHIVLSAFDYVTTAQFEEELEKLKDEGMESLILDLRSNPGGNVSTVTEIGNMILPEGLVFYSETRDGKRTEYECDGKNDFDFPLVVLVNEYSASAAEILTGAVQDSGIGTIVGTQTYGKGVVQTVFSLGDGSGVKLTVEKYYTRGGQDINHVGITPDIEAELDVDAYYDEGVDTQLETAVAVLKGEYVAPEPEESAGEEDQAGEEEQEETDD